MKLVILLICIIGLTGSYASVYSQQTKLNLNVQKMTVKDVLKLIEDQTEFSFMYNASKIDVYREIDINVEKTSVEDVLKMIFAGEGVSYKVINRNIIISSDSEVREFRSSEQQQKSVSGKITDSSGAPLPGVSVVVKGTTTGNITDYNGNYTLTNISENSTLVFSFVGMKSQEVKVEGKTKINVVLEEEAIGIEEVVAVGYGTQKKVNLTGAIDVITNDKLSNRQASSVSQLLQGLTPGTNFTVSGQNGFEPGANMNITIRGIGSLNGGSPYTLINGVPGDVNNLNPEDIESISILKDAASSAIYGAKAAYGVILITTKKGGKNEKMSVSYTGTISLATPPPLPKSLDSYTWVKVQNEAGRNKGGSPFSQTQIDRIIAYQNKDWEFLKTTAFSPGQTYFGAVAKGNQWNPDLGYANNDWWDIYFGHAINQKHDLSLQGGTKNAAYYFSAGYYGQNGYLNYGDDTFNRTNVSGKVDVAISPWWDFSWETRLSKKSRVSPSSTSEGDYSFIFREISRIYPFVPMYDGWGKYMWETHIPSVEGGGTNSLDELDTWNNFKMEIRPIKGWKINADFAYNYYQGTKTNLQKTIYEHMVDNTYSPAGVSVPNYIDRSQYNNTYWTSNVYTSYNLDIKDNHHFMIMAGTQFEYGYYSMLEGYKTNMILQDIPAINTSTGTAILTESLSHKALEGYFGRFSYNYKEKYLLESDVRYDGSYVFRKGNRWGFFPSYSLGWNVHKEPFWQNIGNYINTLKLKASWGQLGNQNISPYSDLELLPLQTGTLNWLFGAGTSRPVGYTTAPGIVNRNLTWETATTTNIGANMSFLDNRLTTDIDLFQRLTTDMVGPQQAKPGVLGASVPNANNSTLRTRGWELTLNWKQKLSNGISYSVNFNLSDYKSIVTKYYNPTGSLSTWYEGREVGEIWGWKVNDLFRTQDELTSYKAAVDMSAISKTWNTGDIKIEDINGDKKITRGGNTLSDHGDQAIIGNDQPRYVYGFNAGIEYKGFDFSMLWRGVGKKDIFFDRWANIFWGNTNGWWESCLQPRTLDYYRDTPGTKYYGVYEGEANINTDAYFPRPYLNSDEEAKNKNTPTTRYLQSGAYLRLQNIQLGYTFPQSIVSKLKLQKVRVALSGENLITFTKLPHGIDPVAPVAYNIGASQVFGESAGVGRLTYGADRIYSISLSVTY